MVKSASSSLFFFNDTATTEIYTLSLHDALPISPRGARRRPLCAWDIPDDLSKPGFLAIAQRGIGDALTLLPSLRALRAARADVRIELVAPGLLVLAENARDTATIVDDLPLAALDDDERTRWLRTRNFAWVWNTEGEQGPCHAAIQAAAGPRWISTATQKYWRGRNVLRVRFAQLARLCPEVRTPGQIGRAHV